MPPAGSLTIVLPAFNESERIGPALDELFGYLRRRGKSARDGAPGAAGLPERIDVLVVDDGSTDGTSVLADELASTARVRVIHHGLNRGFSGAMRTCFRESRGDME